MLQLYVRTEAALSPYNSTLARKIQQLVQNEIVTEPGAIRLYRENGTYIVYTKIQQQRSTRSKSCIENEIVDEGIEMKRLKFSDPMLLAAFRRGPTKLEIEHHVASGHAQHRTWCVHESTWNWWKPRETGAWSRGRRSIMVITKLDGTEDEDDDDDEITLNK